MFFQDLENRYRTKWVTVPYLPTYCLKIRVLTLARLLGQPYGFVAPLPALIQLVPGTGVDTTVSMSSLPKQSNKKLRII